MRHRITPRGKKLVVLIDMDRQDIIADYQRGEPGFRRRIEEYCKFVADAVVRATEALVVEQDSRIAEGELEEGEVKWFRDDLGYGFIRVRTAEEQFCDLFVHKNGIAGEGFKTLAKAAKVRFRRAQGRETEEAVDVTPIDERTDL